MTDAAADVVIVDDNPSNLTLLADILRGAGHRVRAANSARRGLSVIQALPPELVMLDVTMPEMDGYEVCRELQAQEATRGVPVVFISALSEPLDKVRAFEVGAADYVTKPFDAGEVLARVGCQLRLHRLQRERDARNLELERLNEIKNRFLGMAAHDLRSPLSIVLGFTDLLLEEQQSPRHRDCLERVKASGAFMLRLVNDLLDYSAIEAGHLELAPRRIDLVDLLRRCVELNRLLAAPKRVEVEFHGPAEPVPADADPERLEQVLNNLVGNAVKFSQRGTLVEVLLAAEEGATRVSVRDRGQGIPSAELGRLFEPFERTSVKSTGGEKSTGLGLAICRKVVAAHGGRIWAESEAGQGTAFHFTLPVPATRTDDAAGVSGGG